MRLPFFCCLAFCNAASAADLTATEVRWLRAAAPVLAYSQTLHLPVDITVQPQSRPSDVALALGFADGRCKFVLSLRGNPDAEQVLAGVPASDQDLLIETMAAHELGHCWRYVQNKWHVASSGFLASVPAAGIDQREEAYVDLAALAWVRLRHPAQYQQVYRWMQHLRDDQRLSGGSHDTRAWLKLAERLGVIDQPFADVDKIWSVHGR